MNTVTIHNQRSVVSEMESLLIIWFENQVMVINCPINQNTIANDTKLIFERLNEKSDETDSESFIIRNGWFNQFR